MQQKPPATHDTILALFIEQLRKCGGNFCWEIDQYGQIRGAHPDYGGLFCPLSAVYHAETGHYVPTADVFARIDPVSVYKPVTGDIVLAADGDPAHSRRLRKRILRALGK